MHASEWDREIAPAGEAWWLQRNLLSDIGEHLTEK